MKVNIFDTENCVLKFGWLNVDLMSAKITVTDKTHARATTKSKVIHARPTGGSWYCFLMLDISQLLRAQNSFFVFSHQTETMVDCFP